MPSVIQKKSYSSVKIFWLNKDLLNKKINTAVNNIANNCPEVEEIILFGSFCKDKATSLSDIDVLIVITSSYEKFLDRPLKYKVFFEDIDLDVDIFVYTKEEIKTNIPLVKTVFKEGITLFKRCPIKSKGQNVKDL